jgi:hypothetical protein
MATSFDAWYASLSPLEIRFVEPTEPRVSAAWHNYMRAADHVIGSLVEPMTIVFVEPKEYLAQRAKEYEQELLADAKDEAEQFLRMSCFFSNEEGVALAIALAEARNYIEKGYSLESLQQDVLRARNLYIKAYTEMEFVRDSMACIARGERLPTAPPVLDVSSKILIEFVHDAARSAGIPV